MIAGCFQVAMHDEVTRCQVLAKSRIAKAE
jgi:hypothetical protein